MKRATRVKIAFVAVSATLIALGAIRLYPYTLSPTITSDFSSTTSGSSGSVGSIFEPVLAQCGFQDASFLPYGCWAGNLGFLPAGYVLAPHFANSPIYQCPQGMIQSQCQQFQASCGNGVCDPNESCSTCRIDCGAPNPGQCNLYTGRAGNPIAVCQIPLNATIG